MGPYDDGVEKTKKPLHCLCKAARKKREKTITGWHLGKQRAVRTEEAGIVSRNGR